MSKIMMDDLLAKVEGDGNMPQEVGGHFDDYRRMVYLPLPEEAVKNLKLDTEIKVTLTGIIKSARLEEEDSLSEFQLRISSMEFPDNSFAALDEAMDED